MDTQKKEFLITMFLLLVIIGFLAAILFEINYVEYTMRAGLWGTNETFLQWIM